MTDWNWLIPLTNRGESAERHLNFLCRHDDVYVMDNHRAAWWCWLQHLREGDSHQVLHIDQHFDTRPVRVDLPDGVDWVRGMSLEEYLLYQAPHTRGIPELVGWPLFLWDTYLYLHLAKSPDVAAVSFSTWEMGERYPAHMRPPQRAASPSDLPGAIDSLLVPEVPVVVNIDIDVNHRPHPSVPFAFVDGLGREQIEALGHAVARLRSGGRVPVTTIAISPECSGGWAAAERDMRILLGAMGLEPPF